MYDHVQFYSIFSPLVFSHDTSAQCPSRLHEIALAGILSSFWLDFAVVASVPRLLYLLSVSECSPVKI